MVAAAAAARRCGRRPTASAAGAVMMTTLAAAAVLLLLAAPPAAAADAPKSYTGVYGRVTCFADALVKPESTAQLAAAVKDFAARAAADGRALKIRVSRTVFHSSASFTCPLSSSVFSTDGAAPPAAATSAAAPTAVAVLLESLNKVLSMDRAGLRVRVQAGLRVVDFTRFLQREGLALNLGAPTNYGELMIGGVISANGHGTGSNVTSSMGDITAELTWVDAAGAVHVSARGSDEGRALVGGVGLLGIITEVVLRVTPPSNTKAVSINLLPDATIGADAKRWAAQAPNLALMWRPDVGKYNAFLMAPTELPAKPGDRAGIVFPLPTLLANMFQLVLSPLQADVNDTLVSAVYNPLNCLSSLTTLAYLRWASKGLLGTSPAPGVMLDPAIAQAVAVGSTNEMMTGGCEPYCVWNSEITVEDTEFAIELDDFEAWAADVKRVIKQDLQLGGLAPERCTPLGGYFFMRFGRGTDDFGSPVSGMRSPVYVELTLAKSRKQPGNPAKYAYVQDILEQLTLCKYRGRPHWGKNFDRTFTSAKCPVAANLPSFDRLLALRDRYDPAHVFTPVLMEHVASRTPLAPYPGCNLKQACYCSEDAHCAAGFRCVASAAFPEYKACKPAGSVGKVNAGKFDVGAMFGR